MNIRHERRGRHGHEHHRYGTKENDESGDVIRRSRVIVVLRSDEDRAEDEYEDGCELDGRYEDCSRSSGVVDQESRGVP